MLGSCGYLVKIHMITPSNIQEIGKELGDIEIKDYVVLPRGQDNSLPPRPLILEFTMTHYRFGRSRLHPGGEITHASHSDSAPHPQIFT